MNIKIGDLIKKTLSDRKMKLKDFAKSWVWHGKISIESLKRILLRQTY